MTLLKKVYFLNLGFGNKYGKDEKLRQRLLIINIILLTGSFLYIIYDFFQDFILKGYYGIDNITVILLLLNSIFSLILYKKKRYLADKLLTAFLPQLFVFSCAYIGVGHGEFFYWFPLVILGLSILPVLMFDLKAERFWLITAAAYNFIILIFHEDLLLRTADGHFMETYASMSINAGFYKSVQIVLYLFLNLLLYIVIRVNNHQEILCERANKSLARERDRLDYLNAEILAQRNAMNKAASILVTDENGNIQAANRNFCRITGYSLKELMGKNPRIFNSGYHSKKFFREMWQTIKSGNIWSGEIKNKHKDNTYYWLDTTIAPVYNRENKQTGFLAIRFDCTKRKIYEEELVKLNKEKENILYAIAHDLKNPLVNLIAMLQLTKKKAVRGDEIAKGFELMENDCNYSLKLIEQLLEVGRLENMHQEIKTEPVDLKLIVQHCIDQFQEIIDKKRIKVKKKFSKLKRTIRVDIDKFENVINNLLYNAIKFTPEGGEVLISTDLKDDNKTEIKIVDTGIGIPEEQLPYIFDKFTKAGRPGTNGEKSSGLGLWIVKRIIELHNGEIHIFSKVDAGTEVEVILPD